MQVVDPMDATVKIRTLAKAMVLSATAPKADAWEILENEDIVLRGGSKGDGWIDVSSMPKLDEIDWGGKEEGGGGRLGHDGLPIERGVRPGEEGIVDVLVAAFTVSLEFPHNPPPCPHEPSWC
jgi:hypothetical protein